MYMNFKLFLSSFSLLTGLFFCSSSSSFAQSNDHQMYFLSGPVSMEATDGASFERIWEDIDSWEEKKYFLIQFNEIPKQHEVEALSALGIQLEGYIPHFAYFASAAADLNPQLFKNQNIRVLSGIPQDVKINPDLTQPNDFRPLETDGDKVLVSIQAFPTINLHALNADMWQNLDFIPMKTRYSDQLMTGWVKAEKLPLLASIPAVMFIEPAAPLGEPEDREGRSLHRSHAIDNQMMGGRRYDGSGVTMGIADDGAIGPHIDFKGRVTQYTTNFNAGNTHGDMVAGIAVGTGNLDPRVMGMAHRTYLHMYSISSYPHVVPAVANYANLGTTITSTSYSQGTGGVYTSDAATIDNQINSNEMLMHVFSAGNAGTSNHGYGAGSGWGNITGGYKAAKNVMAVANLRNTDQLENSSSRGPAQDGRIKPDIAANGYNQMSTGPNNTYRPGGGTSAASPGIAGIFAQLSHAYRSLNGDSVPPSALLKACMLNTTEDLGNPGPDYRFGWGRVNALRAVKTLEQNHYVTGTISQGDSLTHQITVPANSAQLRVMVYWADRGGVPNASRALVNNLDLKLNAPGTTSYLPWVLNPTPTVAALNSNAVRGVDTLNNAEQVTVDDPAAGTYTIELKGTAIPQGPQRYWVVYEWYEEGIEVTYPMGGEGFVPTETELIRWDASGVTGTFNVQYTTNNGSTWTNIATNLGNSVRHVSWTVPSIVTGQAKVRVVSGSLSDESEQTFSIVTTPANVTVSYICPDELGLSWQPVSGAEGYIIYRLGATHMDSIGVSNVTNFTVDSHDVSQADWFAVAATGANQLRGRRSIAIPKPIDTIFGCPAPPIAGIGSSSSFTCMNQTVDLYDYSANNATSWAWTITPSAGISFVNGTTDTSQSPSVNFTVAGSYSVSLIASNQYGSDTIVQNNLIDIGNGAIVPVSENFASANLPINWGITNPDERLTWDFRNGATPGNAQGGMSWINFFTYNNATGALDELMSPVINLTGISSPMLYFDVAYARYSASLYDGLRVEISTDCGTTYSPTVYFKENLDLATAGTQTGAFTPTASQWRRDSIDLTPYLGNSIRIKFVAINGYGNNLYLTNFEIGTSSGMLAAFNLSGSNCVQEDLVVSNNSSGNITSYAWDFGADATPATATTPGPHTVRYSSTGSKTIALTLTGPAGTVNTDQMVTIANEPEATISFSQQGEQVDFNAIGSNNTSWMWRFGDGNTSTDENPTHVYASSGSYDVRLITSNACGSDTSFSTVHVFMTSVRELQGLRASVYPNPGKDVFNLQLSGLDAGASNQIQLRDLRGRVVYQESLPAGSVAMEHRMNIDFLAAGMYVVEVTNGNRYISLPLVVQ